MLGENSFGVIVLSPVHGKRHAELVCDATGIQLRDRFPTIDKILNITLLDINNEHTVLLELIIH